MTSGSDIRISFDEHARLVEDQKKLHVIMDLLKVDKTKSYEVVNALQDMLAEHDSTLERMGELLSMYTRLKHRYSTAISTIKRLGCLLESQDKE